MFDRPVQRINHILCRLGRLWHYYPELSLRELVLKTVIYANDAPSDFVLTSMEDIEDIGYPKGHALHESRNLEMGIDALVAFHVGEPLPPTPIQTGLLEKLADRWLEQPRMRLGQFLANDALLHELPDA